MKFTRDHCDRCGGTGQYPSACYSGLCLGCGGNGKALTSEGQKARALWMSLLPRKRAGEIGVGEAWKCVGQAGKYQPVREVSRDGDSVTLSTRTSSHTMSADTIIMVFPSAEEAALVEAQVRAAHPSGVQE